MKIRLIRLICVPIICTCFHPAVPYSQIKIGLHETKKTGYDSWISRIGYDTAYVKVLSSRRHPVKKLTADDFIIYRGGDTADILSCTPEPSPASADLAITFILDNSGSMYHAYDSLTTYLDSFIDSLADGFTCNAIAFDNIERKRTYDGTGRESLFLASSEFTSDRQALKNFWHFYDTIRTNLTPLYEAMMKGLERIIDRRKAGDSLRKDIIIIVTDGVDNGSSVTIEKLAMLAGVMPVTLFTVNYNTEPDARLNWLAKKTHGDEFVAENLWQLRRNLDDLRIEIASSYKLIFQFPSGGASGRR